ncbi:MAG: hypothetical protein PHX18_01245 [Candidatus Gastranaerophilales bacterium]|nr:hypothetical protein [Candidatus Gastranaerophilales bacterium]
MEQNTDKDYLMRQYEMYCSMKEQFVDRNFTTNKFYLVTVIIIFVIMFFTKDISFSYNITANIIMSLIGMAVAFFWWSNADAYNIMIKVKLKHVIDEIEKQLPMQIHLLEAKGFSQYKKQHKVLIFSDMQKGVAIAMLLVFFALFIVSASYPVIENFIGPIESSTIIEEVVQ